MTFGCSRLPKSGATTLNPLPPACSTGNGRSRLCPTSLTQRHMTCQRSLPPFLLSTATPLRWPTMRPVSVRTSARASPTTTLKPRGFKPRCMPVQTATSHTGSCRCGSKSTSKSSVHTFRWMIRSGRTPTLTVSATVLPTRSGGNFRQPDWLPCIPSTANKSSVPGKVLSVATRCWNWCVGKMNTNRCCSSPNDPV